MKEISLLRQIAATALMSVSLVTVAAEPVGPPKTADIGAFYKRLNEHKTSLEKYIFLTGPEVKNDPVFRGMASQFLPTLLSFFGRPADAAASFPMREIDRRISLPLNGEFSASPAEQWVTRQAKNYHVVMLNEAHHRVETRLLTLALLPKLRASGYTHFAVETLDFGDTKLKERGYATEQSGFYTAEPVFAHIVREAIRLGYILVPYEIDGAGRNTQQQREDAQAKNLFERTIKHNPRAKVLVHAGYSHITESDLPEFAKPMAMQFKALSGIDVLSIEQTKLLAFQTVGNDPALAKRLPVVSEPAVMLDKKGKAWSACPGQVDATIVLPAYDSTSPHPPWLSLNGRRQAVAIDFSPCLENLPCLAEARHASEPDEAIPADQFLMLSRNESETPLYLPPGKYRLRLATRDLIVVESKSQ